MKHLINTPEDIKKLEAEGCEGHVETEDGKTYFVCTKHNEMENEAEDEQSESLSKWASAFA